MIALPFLLEPNPTESGKLDGPANKLDCTSQPETIMDALFLVFGESGFLIAVLEPTEEVVKCPLKVSQCFLWGALGDMIHLGKLSFFEFIQLFVLFDCICVTFFSLFFSIESVSLFESPVVAKTGSASVSMESGSLSVVWVQLVSVGTVNQHFVFAASIARLARFFFGVRGPYNLVQKLVKMLVMS